ncbi:MAG: dihydrolipoamide acetyltransferase family protein, partial [Terriglobales bacterium]
DHRSANHPSAGHPADASASAPSSASLSAKISPKARRLASEQGVNLARIRGSGPGGEILASDVLAAAETKISAVAEGGTQAGASPAASTPAAGSATARLMAERTTQSWTTVPHFFVVREVDASALLEARQQLASEIEKSDAVKLTHSDLLVALVARVLRKHPRVNSQWNAAASNIRANDDIDIGLAVAVEDGVVAPVIRHADRVSLGEIARQRLDLADRARSGKLRPADLTGGTFTISNLGMFGVDSFTAIIIPPQAAILAVGAIADRVLAIDGQPAVRAMMTLTLSSDHRVIDGARAAVFLRDLAGAIGDPRKCLSETEAGK